MQFSAKHRWITLFAVGCMSATGAMAKVSPEEAEKLGTSLTCVGAEKAGTASGVPEFTGKWVDMPAALNYTPHVGQHPVDPYADEKPLFVVTAQNMAQYEKHLTDGQKALLQKYPSTFRIPVYPGHRDFRYPDNICAAAKHNALNAELSADKMGVDNSVKGAIPFPFPKNGHELAFNNLMPSRAATEDVTRDNAIVLSDGKVVWGRAWNKNFSLLDGPEVGKPRQGVSSHTMNAVLLPERDKGGVSMSSEPAHYGTGKRLTWSYDPGTRRVRQVPEYGFDQPLNGTGGKMTVDSDRLFNGSPERYNWNLVGKKEIFIPANTYKLHGKDVKYSDLLQVGHGNPDYMRYELRRVWVLDAQVREGYRHLYARRVMFLDEDTGMAVMADMYDSRGQLWQQAQLNYYYSPDIKAWQAGTSFYHDLNGGSYLAYTLYQERPKGPILNKMDMTPAMFTPEAARAMGQ